jgi:hypothetical protein
VAGLAEVTRLVHVVVVEVLSGTAGTAAVPRPRGPPPTPVAAFAAASPAPLPASAGASRLL